MTDFSKATLGELAGLAIDNDLIEHCSISKSGVGLSLGRLNVVLSAEDAVTLLRLLIVGSGVISQAHRKASSILPQVHVSPSPRAAAPAQPAPPAYNPPAAAPAPPPQAEPFESHPDVRNPDPVPTEPVLDTFKKHELFRAPTVSSPSEVTLTQKRDSVPVGGDGNDYGAEEISEEYLDSVLNFALSMQIIESYAKDREAGIVTLRTGATTTGLTYWETIEYLTNSMLFELKTKNDQ